MPVLVPILKPMHDCPTCGAPCAGGDEAECTHCPIGYEAVGEPDQLPDYEPRPLTSKERAQITPQLVGTLLDGAKPLKETK